MENETKFTDEEIIKMLECCSCIGSCDGCPLDKVNCGDLCARVLMRNALDLINRQKAEIERLDTIVNPKEHSGSFFMMINEAEEKTEAYIRQLKAETIKEFAERLKTYYRNLDRTAGVLVEYHIDQTVREMLEEG